MSMICMLDPMDAGKPTSQNPTCRDPRNLLSPFANRPAAQTLTTRDARARGSRPGDRSDDRPGGAPHPAGHTRLAAIDVHHHGREMHRGTTTSYSVASESAIRA
jgi:hypothetical protein